MIMTGTRPKRVVAFSCRRRFPGYPTAEGFGGAAPSLIEMANGGLVRNLMGATTNDTHVQRLWGTHGSAEIGLSEKWLQLRLGASGHSPKMKVLPPLDALDKIAAQFGHGGEFWMPYFFTSPGRPRLAALVIRSDMGKGMLQAFRHKASPFEAARFELQGA